MTKDFLDEKRAEIEARILELKPSVDEYRRLESAEQALANVVSLHGNGSDVAKQVRVRTGTMSHGFSGSTMGTSTSKRGRPKGGGSSSYSA